MGIHKQTDEMPFDFQVAVSRNLGWVTSEEQAKIASLHVGIIGLGGVGGQYAEILTRLGVTRFTICDPDYFSVENFNRQNECRVTNYGKNKAQVIAQLIKDINPQATVHVIEGALTQGQVQEFCGAIDIYLDGLDFFVLELRTQIFREMRRLGKTAITAAPLGTGSACLVFTKDSMSFDDYFGLHRTEDDNARSQMFLLGLAPSIMQVKYLRDVSQVNLGARRGPSTPMGVYSCASMVATTIMKLALDRGQVLAAPWCVHYDPYLLKIKKTYVWWGYKNPLQRLKLKLIQWVLSRRQSAKGLPRSLWRQLANNGFKSQSGQPERALLTGRREDIP